MSNAPFGSNKFGRKDLKGSALQALSLDVPGPGHYNPKKKKNDLVSEQNENIKIPTLGG